jgi:tripartite-type tricarboxylate transporter receptor subunit TctC
MMEAEMCCSDIKQSHHSLLAGVGLLILLVFPAADARAAVAYPTKPIRFVVPFPASGSNDVFARIIGEKLTERTGQPVIIDNRPGAATALGSAIVAKAPPDGYTILIISPSFTTNAALQPKLPFDPFRDFAPITMVGSGAFLLVVHPSASVRTVKELVAYANAQPGKLNFASAGTGGIGHLGMELFKMMTKTSMTHVPYKGNPPAFTDLIAGRVQLMLPSLLSVLPHVKSGRLVALAVSTQERSSFAPEIPTIAESGVPGYSVDVWWGILAPGGTPRHIVSKLNQEIVQILQTPAMKKQLAGEGAEPSPMTPEQFAEIIRNEVATWKKVVLEAHVVPDYL